MEAIFNSQTNELNEVFNIGDMVKVSYKNNMEVIGIISEFIKSSVGITAKVQLKGFTIEVLIKQLKRQTNRN